MRFTQDFSQDLDQLLEQFQTGKPFAFVRYGDGERALCERRKLHVNKPAEEWVSQEDPNQFSTRLMASLRANLPDYYLGISCPCCDRASHEWYLKTATAPLERLTYANLLVNANYRRWFDFVSALPRESYLLISSQGGDCSVPRNAVNGDWGLSRLIAELVLSEDPRPILVAAGPASEVIIHKYWELAPQRRTIIDIGSTLDPVLHGIETRAYHDPKSIYGRRVCRWS